VRAAVVRPALRGVRAGAEAARRAVVRGRRGERRMDAAGSTHLAGLWRSAGRGLGAGGAALTPCWPASGAARVLHHGPRARAAPASGHERQRLGQTREAVRALLGQRPPHRHLPSRMERRALTCHSAARPTGTYHSALESERDDASAAGWQRQAGAPPRGAAVCRRGYGRSGFSRGGFCRRGYNRNGFRGRVFGRRGFRRCGFRRCGFRRCGFCRCGLCRCRCRCRSSNGRAAPQAQAPQAGQCSAQPQAAAAARALVSHSSRLRPG